MSLIQELKRRNVFRVGVLYLVAAWLLMQFTDVLSSLMPVPEFAGSLVIMLLMLGFFPVLIFSWVYEMTPDGLKREVDIDRSQSVTPDTGKKINTLIIVIVRSPSRRIPARRSTHSSLFCWCSPSRVWSLID